MDVEEYINRLESPMKEICTALRNVVTALSPDVNEEIKWNVPTYSINKNICSIMAHKKHVNFQIFQGAHIKDSKLLEGTGKDMRHLKLTKLSELDESKIQRMLKQAIAFDK